MHDIAVFDDVLLAFHAQHPGGAGRSFGTEAGVVIETDHFGTDKAAFEIGMNNSGRLRGLAAHRNSPGPHFLGPGGEIAGRPSVR